jgi:nucleoside-diphosphate-sugar epimerase
MMRGRAETIAGTTRTADRLDMLAETGVAPFVFGGEEPSGAIVAALGDTTHLVLSIAPDDAGDPAMRVFGATIRDAMPKLEWIGYLSTVGVYGNHDGGWVDEATEPRPVSRRSIERVAAEAAWRTLAERRNVPLSILRLSGIYGPGRNALANLAEGRARRLVKPGQVFNRIHVVDGAGTLAFLSRKKSSGIFNVTDDEPAPPRDVVAHAARLMGVEPPPETAFEAAELSPMARSFYGENKRVANARIKALGFRFQFSDYRAGLDALWSSGEWR